MANCITRHIPNTVTCCNLLSGCAASVMAFQSNYEAAILFIILGILAGIRNVYALVKHATDTMNSEKDEDDL